MLPFKTKEQIEPDLKSVDEIRKFGEFVEFYTPFAPGQLKKDIETTNYLSIEQIVLLKNFLISATNLKKRFIKTVVRNYFNQLNNQDDIIEEIDNIIDNDDQVRDDASKELLNIRRQKKEISNSIRRILNDLLTKRSNLFTSLNIVERNHRLVLPVKSNFKKDLSGIIHSYSNTGETVFVEPLEITEEAARFQELENKEAKEIEAILTYLTNIVRIKIDSIEQDIECVVNLDILFAKARYAIELNGTMPVFSDFLNIINGYHPILKRINRTVVPLNVKLNSHMRVLLISGPNAGGKTVVLKTVGLIILMAKCGLFIPADEGTSIPFFEEIYADIGDEQSIESNLSTFAAHIKQIKEALNGREESLILLDELMSQTSAEEGSALAASFMERFTEKKGTVLATTHNENLKIFVSKRTDMINAGMEFIDRPTYRLIIGVPQASNAIKLARQLGIDDNIIQSAYSYLDTKKVSINNLFEDLSKELKTVQEERQKLSDLMADYESRLNELDLRKKKDLEQLKEKYKKEIVESKRAIEKLIKTLKKEGPKPAMVQKIKNFFDEKLAPEEKHEPYYPKIGEIVKIIDLKKTGQVIAEQQGKFKVSLENMYFWVDPKDIEAVQRSS